MTNSSRILGGLLALGLIVGLVLAAYFGVRLTLRWAARLDEAFVNQMILTLSAVILGGWLVSRALQKAVHRGERTCRQEQRAEAYAELLECWSGGRQAEAAGDRLRAAEAGLMLWAGPDVLAAYAEARRPARPDATTESPGLNLLREMRKDLGLPPLDSAEPHLAGLLGRQGGRSNQA